jgi:hypothetical protein
VKEREDVEASSLLVAPSISDSLNSVARWRPWRSRWRGSATSIPPAPVPPPRRVVAGFGYHERSGHGRGWQRLHGPAASSTRRVEMGKLSLGTKAAPTRSARGRRRRRTHMNHVLRQGHRIFACREVGAGVRASEGGRGSCGGGRR